MRRFFLSLAILTCTLCAAVPASADTAASYDVTSWLDGDVSSMTGWETGGFYVLTWGNYSNGLANVTAPFIEKWHDSRNGGLGTDHVLQHLGNMPQGDYTLTADIIATFQGNASTTVTGVSLVCGTASTSVATANGRPQRKTVNTYFAGGTLDVGVRLSGTSANWVAFDNVKLSYRGTAEQFISGEKAKVTAELSEYLGGIVARQKADSVAALHSGATDVFKALENLRKSFANMPKPDPISRGLAGIAIGGHPLAYDGGTDTYLASIPEAGFGGDITLPVTYTKVAGWGDLTIDGNTVADGTSYTFKSVSGGKTFTIATTDNDTVVSKKLTFTFLPVVQVYGSFSNDYSKGYIRVNDPDRTGDGLLSMKAKWRGGITNGNGKHKRNYHVKLQAVDGGKEDHSFFGLRDDNNWILESCQVDMARCRNRVLTDLWNDFSTPPYYKASEKKARTGTRGRFVELMLNDKYQGIYCLTENMDRKQMRLKKQDDDGTIHGELWKSRDWSYGVFMGHDYDRNYYPGTSPSGYNNSSETWENYEVKYPDYDDNNGRTDWSTLYNAVNFVCTASDSEFKRDFGSYFDYPLLMDYYILMETVLSADNHGKNMFFAVYDKQKDKKITFGVWDMDATMGQRWSDAYYHRTDIMNPEMDYATYITRNEHGDYNLFRRLRATNYHDFNEEVRLRYRDLRQTWLSTDSILARFSRYMTAFNKSGAEAREAARWNGDSDIEGHDIDFDYEYRYLKDWITKRMNYLDKIRFDIASLSSGIKSVGNGNTSGKHVSPVFSVGGSMLRKVTVTGGIPDLTSLSKGIYIVDGRKYVVR